MGATPREPVGIAINRGGQRAAGLAPQQPPPRVVDAAALVQRLIVERFAPAAVLTDSRFNALYFCGPTDRYLAQPRGGPTQDLLALAREGLRSRLRSAIREAAASAAPVVVGDAQVRRGSGFEAVKLSVLPAGNERGGPLLLVVFEVAAVAAPVALDPGTAAARLVRQMEEELRTTREDLTSTIERQQTTLEDLRASNEEVVSANEELQSMNEELESSKEELQSLNEELNTVNQQLEGKVSDLERADSDLENLLASSEIATLCLDAELHIRWFSPAARALFSLLPSDIGRPVSAFAPMLSDASVIDAARKVMAERTRGESEVCAQNQHQHWYLRRILPYRTQQDVVSGVMVTFIEITDIRRKADEQLAASAAHSQSLEAMIEERMRLLRVELFKLATSEERERHEIAIELHDALCQPLVAATLRMTSWRRGAGMAAEALPAEVMPLIESAERAARSLISRLSPPVLFDMGLVPALEWLAEEMQRVHHLSVHLSGGESVVPLMLDETVRSVVFRCVRELLTNVAKHARVSAAEVAIAADNGEVTVRVSDAGVGFDSALLAQPGAGGRFGLVSVRERVSFVGGTFTLASIPGDGTVATITIPLGRAAP